MVGLGVTSAYFILDYLVGVTIMAGVGSTLMILFRFSFMIIVVRVTLF